MSLRRTVTLTAIAALTLSAAVVSSPAQANVTGSHAVDRVLVKFTPKTTNASIAAAVHAVGANDVSQIADLGVHVLRVPSGAVDRVVAALSHRSDVAFAEPDGTVAATATPNDTYWSQQWGPAKVNAPAAWDVTTGSASTVVAVLDTGVTFTQADLQGRLVPGYDFINNDSDPTDDNGHGTETAGIVGATSNNGTGIAGMCPTCTMMPVKVLDSTAYGSWSAVSAGITWATDHGAKVISMSLAGTTGGSTLQNAVQYAETHDVVVVAAAGNNGNTTPVYPAAVAGVVSVAGTTSTDSLYSWSNYGSWVSVAGPGCDYATTLSGSYGSFCGTSAATPVVAGIVGLARSLAPSATAAQVASALESSAVNIGSVVTSGRVDAAATLQALGASTPPTDPAPAPAPSTTSTTFSGSLTAKASSRSYSLQSGSGQLQLSLSFTKASSLTLTVRNSEGQAMLQTSGASPLPAAVAVGAGTYSLTVSGSTRSSFTLTVTNPTA